jgi:dinuclear metal center YbgI/SA1388 family protein
MKVSDLMSAMEAIAPTRFAASWDNVGLLVGDDNASVSRVLFTVDCTLPIVEEARQEGCDAIVAYHPPIFHPTKRFNAGELVFELARSGIAVYSPHTALDVAAGGTNDVLADALAMTDRTALRPFEPSEGEIKLVTFVPADHVDAVAQSLFGAGAGHIGNYSSCSFRTPGTGTFLGEEGASPAVGVAGKLEQQAEVRLETIVPLAQMENVVRALRRSHPYEEPAFDLVRLLPPPAGRGYGRVGLVPTSPTRVLIDRAKRSLGVSQVLVAGPLERDVFRAAVCAGSGGDLVDDAIASGAQVFLTGELKHRDVLRATYAGLTVVCALHSASERGVLMALERRLSERLPGVSFVQSRVDREPYVFL